MKLPVDHPQRIELNNEVHARPPEPLVAPTRLSYLALMYDAAQREASWVAVRDLCARYNTEPPPPDVLHFSANLGSFRLKWERHTEFVRFMFIVDGAVADPFTEPAITAVPEDWIAALPGQVIVAAHVVFLPGERGPLDSRAIGARWFNGNNPIGAAVSGGAATALTDFQIYGDGFARHLVLDHGTTPWQAGRIAQRLLEIDTYKVMALLALPVARAAGPLLARLRRNCPKSRAAWFRPTKPPNPSC